MSENLVSSIEAFRATHFFVEIQGAKLNSASLQTFAGELEPAAGRPSDDPAFEEAWRKLWGKEILRTREEAGLLASRFIETEGAWGPDDGHGRLANELRKSVKAGVGDAWDSWCYVLDKARRFADPGTWKFED